MNIDLITKENLNDLKKEMICELTEIISQKQNKDIWLKSKEVRQYLRCSEGTLINLRNSGKLPYSKVAGTIYYRSRDISSLLESHLIIQ